MEYIGNRNKVLIHTTVRVNLKNVMLKSKKSNTNDHIVMRFHEFHGISKTESRLLVAWSWEWEQGAIVNG